MGAGILAEHFELLVNAPNGVEKLRKLVRALAVRGALVSQDPNDEPASAILECALAEKSTDSADRRSRQHRIQPENAPYSVPGSWEWSQLEDLTTNVHYGYTASANHELKDVRLLRITDIQDGRVDWEQVPGCEIDDRRLERNVLHDGDLLIARTGGTIGKSYLAQGVSVTAVFASYLIRAIPCSAMNPRYLWLFAQSPVYWDQLYAKSAGTGQPNVNATSLKSLVVPVPPRAEQRRIVAKVDELMALCDELDERQGKRNETRIQACTASHAALTTATTPTQFTRHWTQIRNHFNLLYDTPQNVKELRQLILQLAVQGKLVPQDPNDEPADQLLNRKRAERRAEWEHAELERLTTNGGGPKNDKWKAKYKRPLGVGFSLPNSLPKGWCYAGLESLNTSARPGMRTGPFGSLLKKHEHRPAGVPVLGIENIGKMRFVSGSKIHIDTVKAEQLAGYDARPGDVLISRAGTVGEVCPVPADIGEARFSTNVMRVSLMPDGMTPEFFCLLFNAPGVVSDQIDERCKGSTHAFLNGRILKSLAIPLAPLDEQKRIVAKVDQLMASCDDLESKLTQSQADSEKLMESVVHHLLNGAQ